MTIRIGILGAARIAPKAVIVPARNNPDFAVTAVAARDPAKAEAYAAAHGIPHVAADYAGLVGREDVDLVYVALPPAAHAEWAMAALTAGKAVLCEKPFAMNGAEARAMVAAANAKRPLIEAFHNRFHRTMRRAIEIAASGEIGRLVEAEATFDTVIAERPDELRWTPAQGGGALMDLGCYCIHALRDIAACEPQVTAARCDVERGVDAATEADLAFSNGMTAKLSCSMRKAPFNARLSVRGETGSFEISNFLAPQNGCTFTVTADGKTREEPTDGPSTYTAQLAHIGDVLLRGAAPLTGGADAINNMDVIDRIYAAAGYVRRT
jgi:predicted dehydrogenase